MKDFTSPESTQIKLNMFNVTMRVLALSKATWNLQLVWLEFVGSSMLKKESYHTSNARNIAYFSQHSSGKLLKLHDLREEQHFVISDIC